MELRAQARSSLIAWTLRLVFWALGRTDGKRRRRGKDRPRRATCRRGSSGQVLRKRVGGDTRYHGRSFSGSSPMQLSKLPELYNMSAFLRRPAPRKILKALSRGSTRTGKLRGVASDSIRRGSGFPARKSYGGTEAPGTSTQNESMGSSFIVCRQPQSCRHWGKTIIIRREQCRV